MALLELQGTQLVRRGQMALLELQGMQLVSGDHMVLIKRQGTLLVRVVGGCEGLVKRQDTKWVVRQGLSKE